MAAKPTGAIAPIHAPFGREAFFGIRLTRDPEESYANVVRILADYRARPDHALELCSEWVAGFGCEVLTLADDSELLYVNVGDTYKATLCYVAGRGFFVSSWGDVHEAADRRREESAGERRCGHCSEWTKANGAPCGSCGRDPMTGEAPTPAECAFCGTVNATVRRDELRDVGEPLCDPCRNGMRMDPDPEDDLRHVRLETGHTLRTWDTGKLSAGRTCVGYELCDPIGQRIFFGVDFRPSPLHADDADATLRGLCGFLFLRPGDTDAEYFADYSDRQRAFAESSDCELLAYLYGDEGPGQFAEVEGGDA